MAPWQLSQPQVTVDIVSRGLTPTRQLDKSVSGWFPVHCGGFGLSLSRPGVHQCIAMPIGKNWTGSHHSPAEWWREGPKTLVKTKGFFFSSFVINCQWTIIKNALTALIRIIFVCFSLFLMCFSSSSSVLLAHSEMPVKQRQGTPEIRLLLAYSHRNDVKTL